MGRWEIVAFGCAVTAMVALYNIRKGQPLGVADTLGVLAVGLAGGAFWILPGVIWQAL